MSVSEQFVEAAAAFDVIVIGAGNAGLTAALAAREAGANRVLVLERAPWGKRGGNTAFCGGGMRFAFDDTADLRRVMPSVTDAEYESLEIAPYRADMYRRDIVRTTQGRASTAYTDLLVDHGHDAVRWLVSHGLEFAPAYGRQSFEIDGVHKFWSGAPLEVRGGGKALVDGLTKAAESSGIEIWYAARARSLIVEDSGVTGVVVRRDGRSVKLNATAVVLASGGFEANAEWRVRYLGRGWDLAKVRGSAFNTGDGIAMALDVGAMPYGHWSGCHAVSWDSGASEFGDLDVGYGHCKHHYHLGIMVNTEGRRFVDEGADIRSYTYAKYGPLVLEQPGQVAWQIFDAKVSSLLNHEHYRADYVTSVKADTIEELVARIDGIDTDQCVKTIREFNDAATSPEPFDPTVKDGRSTRGLALPKSNWANPLDTPPFEAFPVTCGITFTFGGLRVDERGQVIDTDHLPMPGLYACGELVGGLFYFNYPGGSGLTWGTVLGRVAGASAAHGR